MRYTNRKGQFDYSITKRAISALLLIFFVGLPLYGQLLKNTEVQAQELISPESDVKVTLSPTPTATPTPSLPDSIEQEIREVFGQYADEALKVAKCESGFKNVSNEGMNRDKSVDAGVFQVNSIHGISKKWLLNHQINIRVAKQIFDESHQSWKHWYSSFKCHGLK